MWHRVLRCARRVLEKSDCSQMTVKDAARLAKCGEAYAKQVLKESSRPYLKESDRREGGKYRWLSVKENEWLTLPDKQIARMLGVRNVGVVSQWRIRHGLVKNPKKVNA